MENREQALKIVYGAYKNETTLVHLWKQRFVPGKGPVPARVMLVGEAPGAAEDAAGEPFVGAAGKVLTLLIRRANLRRQDIFITNVVKFRPTDNEGKNRTPTGLEVEVSLLYLMDEIKIVNPQVIGLMGRTAIQAFFKGKSPGANHGEIWQATPNSRPIVFLYHPAFAAYSKMYLQTLIDDFKSIPKALEEYSGANEREAGESRE